MYKMEFVKLHGRFEFLIPAEMKGKSRMTVLYKIILKFVSNIEFHPIPECFYSIGRHYIYSLYLFFYR